VNYLIQQQEFGMAAGTASVPSRTEAAAPSLLGLQPKNQGPRPHTCTDRNRVDAQLWFQHHVMHDRFCMTVERHPM